VAFRLPGYIIILTNIEYQEFASLATERKLSAIRTPSTASSAVRHFRERQFSGLVLNIPDADSVIEGSSSNGVVANVMPVYRKHFLGVSSEGCCWVEHVLLQALGFDQP